MYAINKRKRGYVDTQNMHLFENSMPKYVCIGLLCLFAFIIGCKKRDPGPKNQPPTFPESPYTFEVPENAPGGYKVGEIGATDPNNNPLTYELSPSSDTFELNEGAILVKKGAELDFETTSSYTFTVHADDGAAEAAAEVNIHIGNIEDSISYVKKNYSTTEGGEAATVEVRLEHLGKAPAEGTTIEIPVVITLRSGASADDYSITGLSESNSLVFTAGDTQKTFAVMATDDENAENRKSLLLEFGVLPPDMAVIQGDRPLDPEITLSNRSIVYLEDNDKIEISFAARNYTATEDGNAAVVEVRLSRALGKDLTISIEYNLQDGATPSDFRTDLTEGDQLTFRAGERTARFEIRAQDDSDNDDGERVQFSFRNPPTDPESAVKVTTSAPSTTTVLLVDNDGEPPTTVSFGADTYLAAEGGRAATVTVDIEPAVVGNPIIIFIGIAGGNRDVDYSTSLPVSGQISFVAGDSQKTFTITAEIDGDPEDGTLTLRFKSLPTSPKVTPGQRSQAIITLQDRHAPPPPAGEDVEVFFSPNTYTASEGGAGITIRLRLSAAPAEGASLSIPVVIAPQGAAVESDYSSTPAANNDQITLIFSGNSTEQSFSLRANDDDDIQDEIIELSLGSLPNGTIASSTEPTRATVSLIDDDKPPPSLIEISSQTQLEAIRYDLNGSGSADNPNNQAAYDAAFPALDANTTYGGYELTQSLTLTGTWTAIDGFNGIFEGSLNTISDLSGGSLFSNVGSRALIQRLGLLNVAVSGGNLGALAGNNAGTIRSCYVDGGTVTSPRTAFLGSLVGTNKSTGHILSSYAKNVQVTGIAGTNYAVGGLVGANESGGAISTCFVKDVIMSRSVISAALVGSNAGRILACYAQDVTTTLSNAALFAISDKNSGQIVNCYGTRGGAVNSGSNGTNSYYQVNRADLGYQKTASELKGPTGYTGIYAAWDDLDLDAGHKVGIKNATAPGDDAPDAVWYFGTTQDYPVLSVDFNGDGRASASEFGAQAEDISAYTVSFERATYIASENDGDPSTHDYAVVALMLDPSPSGSVTIPLTFTPGGGATAADYSTEPASLTSITFGASQATQTFHFIATDDTEEDAQETVEIGFGILPTRPAVTAGSISSTTVEITDDDTQLKQVYFTSDYYIIPEGEGPVSITVALSEAAASNITIPINIVATGTDASEYTVVGLSAGQLSIGAGEMEGSFSIETSSDNATEQESLTLSLGALPSDYAANSPVGGLPVQATTTAYFADPGGLISISTQAQLNAIRYDLNGDGRADNLSDRAAYEAQFSISFYEYHKGYQLSGDLRLSGNWVSIRGTFTGILDGKRHSIIGIRLQGSRNNNTNRAFLESLGTEGIIQNLGIRDLSTAELQHTVAMLVVRNAGIIRNCYVKTGVMEADGGGFVGGMLCINEATGHIVSSYMEEVTVDSRRGAAGILVAQNKGKAVACYVLNSHVVAEISSGIAPLVYENIGEVMACYVRGGSIRTMARGVIDTYSLIANNENGRVVNSYSTAPSTRRSITRSAGTITNSYAEAPVGHGALNNRGGNARRASVIQAPTGYMDIYDTWDDVDLDDGFASSVLDGTKAGTSAADALWFFGTDSDYPALRVDFNDDGVASVAEFGDQTMISYTVAFAKDSYEATEAAASNSATIQLTLTPAADQALDIPVSVILEGGATSSDYSSDPASLSTLTFAAHEHTKTFTITVQDNTVDDDGKRLVFSLGDLSTLPVMITAGQPASTSLLIRDNDGNTPPEVSLSAGNYTATEGGTAAEITIHLTPQATGSLTVTLNLTDQGTTSGDYSVGGDGTLSGTQITVNFMSGEDEKTFTIIATEETEDDDGESLLLRFANPPASGVVSGLRGSSTVFLEDNDGLIPINNFEQLNAIRFDPNGDGSPSGDANQMSAYNTAFDGIVSSTGTYRGYILMRDLDFTLAENYASGVVNGGLRDNWGAIGRYDTLFHGNNKTISRLTIRNGSNKGLFSALGSKGTIRNLGLLNVNINISQHASALVAQNQGKIRNCYVKGGRIEAGNYAGGLVAVNSGLIVSSFVEKVTVRAGYVYGGGLAAENKTGGLVLTSYVFDTTVTGDQARIAGFIGVNEDGGRIVACYVRKAHVDATAQTDAFVYASSSRGTAQNCYVATTFSDLALGIRGSNNYTERAVADRSPFLRTPDQLKVPTDYTGIYANWNIDLDTYLPDNFPGIDNGTTGADATSEDVWDFGTSTDYPKLKVDFNDDGVATVEEFGIQ